MSLYQRSVSLNENVSLDEKRKRGVVYIQYLLLIVSPVFVYALLKPYDSVAYFLTILILLLVQFNILSTSMLPKSRSVERISWY